MQTVAFYSYKGGVGRTLLVANTAQFLATSGRRVVALDLDFEAPGLHKKLSNWDDGGWDDMSRCYSWDDISKGIPDQEFMRGAVDELLHMLTNDAVNGGVPGIQINLPLDTTGALILVPAGAAPSHAYWTALEELNAALRNPSRSGGLPEAVLELQARIEERFHPDFLLIDSRTGITELGGLATSLLADRVVCLTTTARESVEGIKVVADALRKAPRLSSQQPLHLDFLITRVVDSSSRNVSAVKKELELFADSVHTLPHDPGIADEESVLFAGPRISEKDVGPTKDQPLFSATLDWIETSFRGHEEKELSARHKAELERARRRMQQVDWAWHELTATEQRSRGGYGRRDAWPMEQLRQRQRFGNGKESRQADIVAYDSGSDDAKTLMVIEYVEGEDRDAVAKWWLAETPAQVVVVLSVISDNWSTNYDRRIYSRRHAWDSRAHHSDRWDFPLPQDFQALSDPTDVSVGALLDAVRRGHSQYLDRIVTEWVRCSAVGLHGGCPWKPDVAKRILDSLARVDDVELARRILWAASADSHRRGMWLSDDDDYLIEQVLAELFAPLLWRLPPEASIDVIREHCHRRGLHGRPSGLLALGLLARNILGLQYDPDATFRIEGQRILDKSGLAFEMDFEPDNDRGLHGLASAFKHTEVSFKLTSDLPELATRRQLGKDRTSTKVDIDAVIAGRIARRYLVTTGLLGDYQPQTGCVVLYTAAIDRCADNLALQSRHVSSVTLIHETLHALMHLGRDLDGHMWPEFALPDSSTPLFEPSWFHETLTQYFTYQHLLRLGDAALMHAFETMSDKQAPPYRAWRRLKDLPIEDVRSWFLGVRRGVAGTPPAAALLSVTPDAD